MGRKRIEIDLKLVESLAMIQCTDEEIAAVLGVCRDSVEKWKKRKDFSTAYKRGKEKGRTSLRRLQWKAAQGITYYAYFCDKKQAYSFHNNCEEQRNKKGSVCGSCPGARHATLTEFKGGATGMQIWLGKQWLGQQDNQKVEHSGKMGITLTDELKQIREHLKSYPEEKKRLLKEVEDE